MDAGAKLVEQHEQAQGKLTLQQVQAETKLYEVEHQQAALGIRNTDMKAAWMTTQAEMESEDQQLRNLRDKLGEVKMSLEDERVRHSGRLKERWKTRWTSLRNS